ncbi:DENN domain containing pinstripe [Arctopsyche grandis]|uniref:DENN domain containing pinstripe n=1 Tax=Arctopsyche grandis TaxID=121162 RepID=UPI00406D83B4
MSGSGAGQGQGQGQGAQGAPAPGANPLAAPRLVDYFVVCGLDIESGLEPDRLAGDNLHCSPLDRPYKGKALAHYPTNVLTNPFDEYSVCMFCLPTGLLFRTQKHVLDPQFHSFVITREDASRYYGFSLVFYEEVRNRNICSAMHTLQAMYITELSSGQTPPSNRKIVKETCRSLPRSFKLSPHVSGAAVSYYDITKDKLYVSKSIALICRHAYVRAARLFLSNLYKSLPRQPGPGLSPEAFVYNILYEVNLPSPGQTLKFFLPPLESHLSPISTVIYRPRLPDELPLLDYQLREMFVLLGAECIIQLFTCVLLENQVLLRSSDYNRLMLVAECIISLLFPFCWPHVYVPILPLPLHHFLDAPVPFVMGLHLENTSCIGGNGINKNIFLGTEAALCLVDIDKMSIQLPEELPTFPYRNAFKEEISQLLDKFQICKPDVDQSKFYTPINGLNQRHNYHDPMSSSCTLPTGGGSRRKHSFNDILDWDESHILANSPPSSPTHHSYYHNSHHSHQMNRITPPRSDALQRIVDIARRTGVNLDDLDAETVMPTNKKKVLTDDEQYQEDLRFNNAMRETFLNRFVHMFSAYEHFVILPDQDKESWLSSRESMQNFDKAAFLSDQPEQHRPFLSRFLESQMFATLIDNKIMSSWGDIDENVQLFDNRIKILRKRCGGDSLTVRSSCYEPYLSRNYELLRGEKRLDIDEIIPPQEIHPHRAAYYRAFPLLDAKLLEPPLITYGERANSLRRAKGSNVRWQSKDISIESTNVDVSRITSSELPTNTAAPNNKAFIEKLLKDCKSKTKKMLLEKMGSEAVDLGLGIEVSVVGVEENTMIASLCDLLERIWSHGLQHKYGKSALWMHLINFQELEQCNDTSKPIDPNFLTPDLSTVGLENESAAKQRQSPNRSRDSSRSSSRDSSRDRLSSGSNTLERKQNTSPLRPLTESLTFDMRNIQAMSDIKTEIGYARAWVRLSLEKKLLSKHLKTLLADSALLKSQYKRTAFLRCEDEREQFLYHLLTLNAVDYYCFTNTYPMTKLPYRVVVVPSRKASATTANCWISMSGTSGETQQIPIPRNTLEFVFHHKNLGILTTLRIGHDNSGLSPRWMLENVYVRNEVTGHTYRFPCNRWLGRGVDDGSTERLLVAQLVTARSSHNNTMSGSRYGQELASTSSTATPASPAAPVTTHLSPSTVQHMIGDCVNAIVKWHYRSKREKDVNSLSVLLCGENGLVKCLEQAFLCGFKSNRLFGRNLFIWDYFVRVKEVFEQNLTEECLDSSSESSSGVYSYHSSNASTNRSQEHTTIWRCYCHLMDEINNAGHALGKDGKFQLFICLSLREHWLHRMLVPMSVTRVTTEMYEEQSFLRKRGLLTFLRQILEPLDEFNIVLENSLTQGISSYP